MNFQLFLYDIQAKYLSNHAEHYKRLVPYYILPYFTKYHLIFKTALADLNDRFQFISFSHLHLIVSISQVNLDKTLSLI